MKINLREEETELYIKTYNDYLDEVGKLNKRVMDVFGEVMTASKYDRLQKKIAEISDTYEEQVAKKITEDLFNFWTDSKGSLRSCLRQYQAGDAADEVCLQIENKMSELSQEILKIEKMEAVVTERPIVSEDGLEQLEEACKSAREKIADIENEYLNKANTKYDENEIFGTLHPLFKGIEVNHYNFFDGAFNSFAKLHEEVKEISAKNRNIADDNVTEKGAARGNDSVSVQSSGGSDMENNSQQDEIDEYLFKYITETVLGKTELYKDSLWYKDEARVEDWKNKETVRLQKRDEYIKCLLAKMKPEVKKEWKYAIENKDEVSGRLGYKKEEDKKIEKSKTEESKTELRKSLSKVETARLWQGSFKAGQHTNQYKGRDKYYADTLDEKVTLYRLQSSDERDKGNYFITKADYDKIKGFGPTEIYSVLQLSSFYGDEDSGKMKSDYKMYFMEYEVKQGGYLDVARGLIEANGHLATSAQMNKIEQIFVTDDDFDNKLVDLSSYLVNMDEKAKIAEFEGKLFAHASNMNKQAQRKSIYEFKRLTEFLRNTIENEAYETNKILNYEKIKKIMPIYKKFYTEFGELLKDSFKSFEEKEKYIKREYIGVTRDNGNEKFFVGDEAWTFKSHAYNRYTVFNLVADMVINIVTECEKKQANDSNLRYGIYVLFDPIISGRISEDDGNEYSKFSKWASDEIIRVLDLKDDENMYGEDYISQMENDFSSEEFSEENIRLFVKMVEIIVKQTGVDELNACVEKNYSLLHSSRKAYTEYVRRRNQTRHNVKSDTYGRYTVTRRSIHIMEDTCGQIDTVIEPIDKFYKEKFKSLGESFDKANAAIHAISSFCGLWGLSVWNLSKLFSSGDSEKTMLEKVMIGGVALSSYSKVGVLVTGGIQMLKVLDWAMPYLKKSK